MKHIWVVESSSGRKWEPAGTAPMAYFTKRKLNTSWPQRKNSLPASAGV